MRIEACRFLCQPSVPPSQRLETAAPKSQLDLFNACCLPSMVALVAPLMDGPSSPGCRNGTKGRHQQECARHREGACRAELADCQTARLVILVPAQNCPGQPGGTLGHSGRARAGRAVILWNCQAVQKQGTPRCADLNPNGRCGSFRQEHCLVLGSWSSRERKPCWCLMTLGTERRPCSKSFSAACKSDSLSALSHPLRT